MSFKAEITRVRKDALDLGEKRKRKAPLVWIFILPNDVIDEIHEAIADITPRDKYLAARSRLFFAWIWEHRLTPQQRDDYLKRPRPKGFLVLPEKEPK